MPIPSLKQILEMEEASNPPQGDIQYGGFAAVSELLNQEKREKNLANRGSLSRALLRGVDQTQGSLYAAGGALGGLAGSRSLAEWGARNAQRNEEEASLNPASVPTLGDIRGVGDAVTWAGEKFAENIPFLVSTLATSGMGAWISGGGKILGSRIIAQGLKGGIEKRAAASLGAKAADKALLDAAISGTEKWAGSAAGTVLGAAPIEAGGNWSEAVTADPSLLDSRKAAISSIGTGIAAGLLETWGGNFELFNKVFGANKGNVIKKTVGRIGDSYRKGTAPSVNDLKLLRRFAGEALDVAKDEAKQETLQELLSVTNMAINDPNFEVTGDTALRVLESAAAGGTIGAFTGGIGGAASKKYSRVEKKINALSNEQLAKTNVDYAEKVEAEPENADVAGIAKRLAGQMPYRMEPGTPIVSPDSTARFAVRPYNFGKPEASISPPTTQTTAPLPTRKELLDNYLNAKKPTERNAAFAKLHARVTADINTAIAGKPATIPTTQKGQQPPVATPGTTPGTTTTPIINPELSMDIDAVKKAGNIRYDAPVTQDIALLAKLHDAYNKAKAADVETINITAPEADEEYLGRWNFRVVSRFDDADGNFYTNFTKRIKKAAPANTATVPTTTEATASPSKDPSQTSAEKRANYDPNAWLETLPPEIQEAGKTTTEATAITQPGAAKSTEERSLDELINLRDQLVSAAQKYNQPSPQKIIDSMDADIKELQDKIAAKKKVPIPAPIETTATPVEIAPVPQETKTAETIPAKTISAGDNYEKSIAIAERIGDISLSGLQRELGIGYGEARDLVERMTNEGIIKPIDNDGKRKYIGKKPIGTPPIPTETAAPEISVAQAQKEYVEAERENSAATNPLAPDYDAKEREKSKATIPAKEEGESNVPIQAQGEGEEVALKPAPIPKPSLETKPELYPSSNAVAQIALSEAIVKRLRKSSEPIDVGEFFNMGDLAFGGTRAEGKYGPSDAYDALELAVNKIIVEDIVNKDTDPNEEIKRMENLENRIPTQRNRSGEKDAYQQFSTPPAYAYVVNWLANIGENDVVMEPEAGTGSLAMQAQRHNPNALIMNELSKNRLALLSDLKNRLANANIELTNEDAEQIHNILGKKLTETNKRPTVVVMNPPFSHAAERMGVKTVSGTDLKHIDASLGLLQSNGRLVAIMGAPMIGEETKTFLTWYESAKKKYNIRANVIVGRDVYKKYGTTYPTRVLVIDKTGFTSETITGTADTLGDLVQKLEVVRNDRIQPDARTEQKSTKPTVQETARAGEGEGGTGHASQPTGGGMGAGKPGVRQSDETARPGDEGENISNVRNESDASTMESVVDGGEKQPSTSLQESRGSDSGEENAPGRSGESASGIPVREPSGGKSDVSELKLEGKKSTKETKKEELTENIFEPSKPSKVNIKGMKKHPGSIVESTAMASVESPNPIYKPHIQQELIDDGKVSDIQLESVVYAGQAHEQFLPAGEGEIPVRRGFLVGDGTGTGKGTIAAAIILDNFNQGRKKAIWISQNEKLFEDAKRDWNWLEQDENDLFYLGKTNVEAELKAKNGILFSPYSTLIMASKKNGGKSRLQQIIDWVGEDFDGVIVFDEAHNMGNSIKLSKGKNPSQKALVGIELQNKLPKARVVYLSATAATEVENLGFATRLGLWGRGTEFPTVRDFITKIIDGGVAAMELVARDMKALGSYMARSLSLNDGTKKGTVEVSRMEHVLSKEQEDIYDNLAESWGIVLNNIGAALALTGGGSKQKRNALGQFWSSHQRFFNQIVTSMQMPTVIKNIQTDLDNGESVVIQLTNTNEASQKRELAKREELSDLEDFDLTPRDILMQYLQNSFPVNQQEEYEDESGNIGVRDVVDSQGNPVMNMEAVAMREALLDKLGSIRIPESPLDMMINHFGHENVAEVTGRQRRVIYKDDVKGGRKKMIDNRSTKANQAEIDRFQNDFKRILIFSEAGATGASYHASNLIKNQSMRNHYLLQAGWRAATAIQGLGRSHRSNQAQAPRWKLVTTNIPGHKRFISTIAKRLNQLGALTRGQRQAGSSGMFTASDNLESKEAMDALRNLFFDIQQGNIEGIDIREFESQTGLKLQAQNGSLLATLPEITQFLNRLLSMKLDMQNKVFSAFDEGLSRIHKRAEKEGTADKGVEVYRADSIEIIEERVVHVDERTGAETKYIKLNVKDKIIPRTYKEIKSSSTPKYPLLEFIESKKTGKLFAVYYEQPKTEESGRIVDRRELVSPDGDYRYVNEEDLSENKYNKIPVNESENKWRVAIENLPKYKESKEHIITGVILPIWNRIKGEPKIYRLQTDSGEHILGRVIPTRKLDETLRNLGATAEKQEYTIAEIVDKLLDREATIKLSNDWRIVPARIGGEDRIELIGPDYAYNNQLQNDGVFIERVQFKTRYFIPAGERAETVLRNIITANPIVDVIPTTGGNEARFSKTKAVGYKRGGYPIKNVTWFEKSDLPEGAKEIDDSNFYDPTNLEHNKLLWPAIVETLDPMSDIDSPESFTDFMRERDKMKAGTEDEIAGDVIFDAAREAGFDGAVVTTGGKKHFAVFNESIRTSVKASMKKAANGKSVGVVRRFIASVVGKLNVPVQVVQSISDLPKHLADQAGREAKKGNVVKGVFDPVTKNIYLVADGIANRKEALMVLIHESVGHLGMRRVVGEQLNEFVSWMLQSKYADDIRSASDRLGVDIRTAAEEWFAEQTESGRVDKSLWNRFVAMIRRALKDMGFNIEFTNTDMRELIRRSHAAVLRNNSRAIGSTVTEQGATRYKETSTEKVPMQKALLDRAEKLYGFTDKLPISGFIAPNGKVVPLGGEEHSRVAEEIVDTGRHESNPLGIILRNGFIRYRANHAYGGVLEFNTNLDSVQIPIIKKMMDWSEIKRHGIYFSANRDDGQSIYGEIFPKDFDKFVRDVDDFFAGRRKGGSIDYEEALFKKNAPATQQKPSVLADLKEETRTKKWRRNIQNIYGRLEDIQKEITETVGQKLPLNLNAYSYIMAFPGVVRERIGKIEARIFKGDNSIIERFMLETKLSIDDLGIYLVALHAKERNADIRTKSPKNDAGIGMTDEQAESVLAYYAGSGIEKYGQEMVDIAKKALLLRFRAGLITQEHYDYLTKKFVNYVPAKGKGGMESYPRLGKGFSLRGKEILNAFGRSSLPDNPAMQIFLDYKEAIIRAHKNKADNRLLRLIKKYPDKIWKAQKQAYIPHYDKWGNITGADPRYKVADNVIEMKVKGKPYLITIEDKALVEGLKKIGVTKGLPLLYQINSFMRMMVTVAVPEFVFLTNPERDIQTALIHLAGEHSTEIAKTTLKNMPDAMRGIRDNINGRNTKLAKRYQEMKDHGGKVGWLDMATNEHLQKQIEFRLRKFDNKNIQAAKELIYKVSEYVKNWNETMESGVRFAAYMALRDSGVGAEEAAVLVKDLTVDFDKIGNWGAILNSLYMFSGASIQGSYRILFKAMKHPRVQKIAGGIIAASFLSAMLNRWIDPDEYDQFTDYAKDNHWLFMTPSGKALAIKTPYGYNVLKVFGNVMEELLVAKKITLPQAGARILGAIGDAFNPLGYGSLSQMVAPTIIDPFIQLSENKNFFGAPIRKEQSDWAKKPDSQMYFSSVRTPTRMATDWINRITGGSEKESGAIDINPEDIDHLIDAIGGGLGKFVANSIATGSTLATGDIPKVDNLPFLRQVVKEKSEWVASRKAFDMLKESSRTKYSEDQVKIFELNLERAIENKVLDLDDARRMRMTFRNNQRKIQIVRNKQSRAPSATPPRQYGLSGYRPAYNEPQRSGTMGLG